MGKVLFFNKERFVTEICLDHPAASSVIARKVTWIAAARCHCNRSSDRQGLGLNRYV